jgi:hypothetical protein
MCNNGLRWRLGLGTILACWAIIISPLSATAAEGDEDEYGHALDWVPADASLFSTSLQLKRQIDIVADSNAWQAFREIPSVATVWQMAEMQVMNPDGPAAMFWQLMELPENQQLAAMLGEMFSEEIAFYAAADVEKLIELGAVIQGSKIAPLIQAASGEEGDANQARLTMIVESIVEDPSLLAVPQAVLAFSIEDEEAATTQLKRLEVLANMALKQSPLDVQVAREEIGESEFLVLTLDGTMIPWEDEVPTGVDIDQETYDSLREIVSEKELTIALGVWNGYVLLSIGEDAKHLETLGEGDLLAEKEELEYLEDHLEEDVVGIQYASAEVVRSQVIVADDIDEIVPDLEELINTWDQIPDSMRESLVEDLHSFADDIKGYLPVPGAMTSCTLLTDTGFESFTYNWTPQPRLDASQALEIANHLGGSPIIAVAARGTHNPEDYELLAKWVGKGIKYFQEFGLEELDEDDQEKAKKAMEIALPILERIDATTREFLIPAFEDSQSALVIDADITSKQWHSDMPESFTPLPMAEVALVMGVSDVESLMRAMAEYKQIADDLIEAIRKEDPDSIPEDYEIPAPEVNETDDGTLYTWSLGDDVDEQIALVGAVGEHVAAFATSTNLAERVLAEEPVAEPEALNGAEEPRAVLAGINFAALVDAIGPWIEYGIRTSVLEGEGLDNDPADDPSQAQDICSQVKTGLEILKCFRGAWSEVTEDEDGVWVTHTVSEFKDLEE